MKIGVYTDEPVSAQGLLTVIASQDDHEGKWIPTNPENGLGEALEENLGMVVVDCAACDPLVITAEVRRWSPGSLPVLWARELAVGIAGAALNLGVRGIVRKTASTEQIALAFRVIATGELWLERKLTCELLSTQHINLSPRESELVNLVSRGLKNREIAEEMNLSEGTVKVYLSRLFEKTGTRDRFSLALLGLQHKAQSGANMIVRQVVENNTSARRKYNDRSREQASKLATSAGRLTLPVASFYAPPGSSIP